MIITAERNFEWEIGVPDHATVFLLVNFNSYKTKHISIQNFPHCHESCVLASKMQIFLMSAEHVYVSPHIY